MVPFVVLSAVASCVFLPAAGSTPLLFLGRFLQGAVSGVVFSTGSAWMAELLDDPGRSARRTTAALSLGWSLGPLTSGLLATWAPAPTVLPYLLHLALLVVGLRGAGGGAGDRDAATRTRRWSGWACRPARAARSGSSCFRSRSGSSRTPR